MTKFSDVIGHEDIIKHFKSSMELGKVSHAYILNGEKGAGKKTLASLFSQTLQCEKQGLDPCIKCHSCKQCETGNQPDIIWVTHKKENIISVDEIREQVNKDISIRPYSSKYKIYIIADAHMMNPQAQNALLKTVEEPPEYAVIILLTSNVDKFLPTIISRCIVLNFKPVGELAMMDYLIKNVGVSEKKARFCTDFAQGNIGKAVRLATSEDYNAIKKACIKLLRNIQALEIDEIISMVKSMGQFKMELDDYIDIMTMWYRDLLILKISGTPDKMIFKEEYSAMKNQASKISYEGIEKVLEALNKVKIRLEANVNFDVALELMLLTMKDHVGY